MTVFNKYKRPGACLKNAFFWMYDPLSTRVCYGRFVPNEEGIAGYVDQIWRKYRAERGVQMAGMNLKTRSSISGYNRETV